jgi:CubicO group peptidase (beta-lactamase class C family)
MAMNGGILGGQRIVPASWIQESSTPDADFLKPKANGPKDEENFGYGFRPGAGLDNTGTDSTK